MYWIFSYENIWFMINEELCGNVWYMINNELCWMKVDVHEYVKGWILNFEKACNMIYIQKYVKMWLRHGIFIKGDTCVEIV